VMGVTIKYTPADSYSLEIESYFERSNLYRSRRSSLSGVAQPARAANSECRVPLRGVRAGPKIVVRSRSVRHDQGSSGQILNNVVEQDHRAIKCFAWSMPGFKDFDSARVIPRGVEVMHHDQEREDEVRQRNAASCRQPVSLSRFISNP
jgi:hypothetical protein